MAKKTASTQSNSVVILRAGELIENIISPEIKTYIDCQNPKEGQAQAAELQTKTEPIFTFILQTNSSFSLQIPEIIISYISKIYDVPSEEFGNIHLSLSEAILNAIEHGNLEMSDMKSKLISSKKYFEDFYNERDSRLKSPLGERLIIVKGEQVRNDLTIHVHHQGKEFDIEKEKHRLMSTSDQEAGRGLKLIQTMAQNLSFADHGRTCSMVFPLWPEKTIQDRQASQNARKNGIVLVVDDDPFSRTLAEKILTQAGFQNILTATSGEEGIQLAGEHLPDLILLDIFMEGMSGFDACRRLKQQKGTAHIPILFLSGAQDSDSRTKGFDLGAVDFLTKPIEPVELIARAETHLKNGILLRDLKIYQQRVSNELEQARRMQMRLVPKENELIRAQDNYKVSIHSLFQPSQELAGDYWNLFEVSETTIGLFFADFTGHGLASALNTMMLHSALSDLQSYLNDPQTLMEHIDRRLQQDAMSVDRFATALYALYNKKEHTLTFCGRGAPPFVWVKESQRSYELIKCKGVPLGLGWAALEQEEFQQTKIHLEPGDTLMFYSDALLECTHTNEDRWFEEGLKEALDHYLVSDQILFSSIRQQFFRTVKTPLEDDLTLVTLHVLNE